MRRGFSLIEILIVVALIGLLAGLAVVGAGRLREGAQAKTTKAIVSNVATLVTDIQAEVKTPPRFTGSYGSNPLTDYDSIRYLIDRATQVKATKDKLSGIPGEYLVRKADGTPDYVVDEWGTPLRFSRYERVSTPMGGADVYGSNGDGMPQQNRPYVASAGPDQQWGSFTEPSGDGELVPDEAAKDNLYSFDVN